MKVESKTKGSNELYVYQCQTLIVYLKIMKKKLLLKKFKFLSQMY